MRWCEPSVEQSQINGFLWLRCLWDSLAGGVGKGEEHEAEALGSEFFIPRLPGPGLGTPHVITR